MADDKEFQIFTQREIETIKLYESPDPTWLTVKAIGEIVFLLKSISDNLSVLTGFIKEKTKPNI